MLCHDGSGHIPSRFYTIDLPHTIRMRARGFFPSAFLHRASGPSQNVKFRELGGPEALWYRPLGKKPSGCPRGYFLSSSRGSAKRSRSEKRQRTRPPSRDLLFILTWHLCADPVQCELERSSAVAWDRFGPSPACARVGPRDDVREVCGPRVDVRSHTSPWNRTFTAQFKSLT